MSTLEEYYKNILDKIKKHIDKKEYDKAIFILEDELDAPYVPIEFQTELEELLITVETEQNYFQGLNKVEKLNREQLLNSIIKNNELNTSALHLFFERYNNDLTNDELNIFEDHFLNRKIDNSAKTALFESLAYQRIDHSFRFFNNNLKEEFSVNPISTLIVETIPLYTETKKIIEDLNSKEPSLLNFCYDVLLLVYWHYFPLIPDYNHKDLAHSICEYMLAALESRKPTKNQITDLINEILKKNQ